MIVSAGIEVFYPSMNEVTLFTPAQCRSKAEAKLALADRDEAARETLVADAEAWLLLADRLEDILRIYAVGLPSSHAGSTPRIPRYSSNPAVSAKARRSRRFLPTFDCIARQRRRYRRPQFQQRCSQRDQAQYSESRDAR
jgi:hypothetical protein